MLASSAFTQNSSFKTLLPLGLLWFSGSALAEIEFDQNVNPDVLFGSGVDNGSFTTDRRNGIELGLRGKLRFPPSNVFNSGGDGSYSFEAGEACPGFSFAPCQTTPVWSFEWTINTDTIDDTQAGRKLEDLTYELGLDGDPGPGTDFLTFDNVSTSLLVPLWDHATGDNSTPNGGGVVAPDAATYEQLLEENNVAQNSWSYEFFNNLGTSLETFDPNEDGNYVIYLEAKDPKNGRVLAKTQIQILVGNAKQYRQFKSQAKN